MTKLTLAQMLALQKEPKNEKTVSVSESSQPPAVSQDAAAIEPKPEVPAQGDNLGNDSAKPKPAGLAFLKGAVQPAAVAQPTVPTPQPAKPGLAFLAKAGGDSSKELQQAAPAKSAPVISATPTTSAANTKSNLEILMDSTGGTLGTTSRFADEIPATAPVRELPPELAEQAVQFTKSLDSVYQCLHEPELLGGVIRGVMIELSNHPEYRKLISPMDYHTMVKGMRESMGMARIKKEESKAKRTPSKKSTVITDLDALNALEGMNFD